MKKARSLLTSLLLILLISCNSQQQVLDINQVLEAPLRDVSIIQNVQPRLTLGTEEDLAGAEKTLLRRREDFYAQELLYLIQGVRQIVYPWEGYGRPYSLPGENQMLRFIEQIKSGELPDQMDPEYSLIYLNFAPLVILYSDNAAVLLDADDLLINADLAWGSSFLIPFLQGVAQYKLGGLETAQLKVEEALELYPFALGHYYLARIYLDQENYLDSRGQLEILRAQHPDQEDVPVLLGQISFLEGAYGEALSYYDQVETLSEEDQYRKAYSLGQEGLYPQGLRYLDSVFSRNMPLNFWTLYLAYQKEVSAPLQDQLRMSQGALGAYPIHIPFVKNTLNILYQLEDKKAIRNLLNQKGALLTQEDRARGEFEIAVIEEDWSLAAQLFSQYPQIVPEDFPHYWKLYRENQNWDRIISLAEQELTRDRYQDYWQALYKTGARDKLQQAINTVDLSRRENSALESDYYFYRSLYERRREDKLTMLLRSLQLNPGNTKTMEALAELYFLSGEIHRARFYIKQLELLEPEVEKWRVLLEKWSS